jgi:predicted oxidoreductase
MENITLSEEITLSRVIQGFWRLHSWNWTPEELYEFMIQAIELGVTTFDTAEIYGNYTAEAQLGEVLKRHPELRSKIQIITKTGINKPHPDLPYTFKHYETSYDKIIASCNASLEKLNTEYIDVYLIHREDPFFDHHGAARAFKQLKDEGKIRSYGVCNYDPIKFFSFNTVTGHQLVTDQIEVSPLVFEHFNSGLMDLLQSEGVHPMFWSPLAGGSIFTSQEPHVVNLRTVLTKIAAHHQVDLDTIVYAWLLMHPVKGLIISGSQKLDRLKNAIAGLSVKLDLEEWYEIYLASGQQVLR